MKYRSLGFAFALAMSAQTVCLAAEVGADCSRPSPPSVPNGEVASEDELITTQTSVKQFKTDAETYLECLKKAEAAAGEELTDEQRQHLITMYNSMVDQLHGTAEQFNSAVRAFKARSK